MKRAGIVFLVSCIALGACTQRLICPAYQSAFIYDQEALRKKFSYFNEDSTPKILTASKNKYLIAEPVSYHKKIRSLQTVAMKPVYPVVPDSLKDDFKISTAEMDSATHSVIDSTYIVDTTAKDDSIQTTTEDSVYVITKDKELRLLKYDPDSLKYKVVDVRLNVDQDNYMWYLRNYLVLPDARLAMLQSAGKKENAAGKKSHAGFFGFFKNLFKKKNRNKIDSTNMKPPVKSADDYDYVDTLEAAKPVVTQQQSKKKGLFSFLKKKKKTVSSELDQPRKKEDSIPEEMPAKKDTKDSKNKNEVPDKLAEPVKKEDGKGDGF